MENTESVEGLFTLSSEDDEYSDDEYSEDEYSEDISGIVCGIVGKVTDTDAILAALNTAYPEKVLYFITLADLSKKSASTILTHATILRYSVANARNAKDALEYVCTYLQDKYNVEIDSEFVFKEALRVRSDKLTKWCISNTHEEEILFPLVLSLSDNDIEYVNSCDPEWLNTITPPRETADR